MRSSTPTLHCDAEDGFCGAWDVDYDRATVSAVNGIQITDEERAPGWTTADGEDFCPEHSRTTTPPEPHGGTQ